MIVYYNNITTRALQAATGISSLFSALLGLSSSRFEVRTYAGSIRTIHRIFFVNKRRITAGGTPFPFNESLLWDWISIGMNLENEGERRRTKGGEGMKERKKVRREEGGRTTRLVNTHTTVILVMINVMCMFMSPRVRYPRIVSSAFSERGPSTSCHAFSSCAAKATVSGWMLTRRSHLRTTKKDEEKVKWQVSGVRCLV